MNKGMSEEVINKKLEELRADPVCFELIFVDAY
jgi:hypothetical protein